MGMTLVKVLVGSQRNGRWFWRVVAGKAPRGTRDAGGNYARKYTARRGAQRAMRPKRVSFV